MQIDWKQAEGEMPSEHCLVIHLASFYGSLIPEITIAYFDNPEDYIDGGRGWLTVDRDLELRVTHYCELPKVGLN